VSEPKSARSARLTCAGHHGDADRLPYVAWHERSAEAKRHGERQERCEECGRYFWSWELRRAS
jgi:hypothetical protein